MYGSALSDYSLRYDLQATHTLHRNDELSASLGYQYNAGELNLSMVRGERAVIIMPTPAAAFWYTQAA